jgi:hypothetical protein
MGRSYALSDHQAKRQRGAWADDARIPGLPSRRVLWRGRRGRVRHRRPPYVNRFT